MYNSMHRTIHTAITTQIKSFVQTVNREDENLI